MTWQYVAAAWLALVGLVLASDCGKRETDEERDERMSNPRYPY